MCAHFGLSVPVEDFQLIFPEVKLPPAWEPQFNLSPSEPLLVLQAGPEHLDASLMRWGLLPRWETSFDLAKRKAVINARAETLFDKPFFAPSAKKRRCLLPATHFFEWQKDGKLRHPYLIHPADDSLLYFAGLWDSWKPEGAGEAILNVALITVAANQKMNPVHDRMPALLAPASFSDWLSPATPIPELAALLRPAPNSLLQLDPIDSMRQL